MNRNQSTGLALTRTAMASGRGPLVLRLSLASSTTYSHSRPTAAKVRLVTSLPLGLRMKLPVTWFFTTGQGKRGTQISVPLHRSKGQISSGISRPSQWVLQDPVYLSLLPLSLPPDRRATTLPPHSVPTSGPWCIPFLPPSLSSLLPAQLIATYI